MPRFSQKVPRRKKKTLHHGVTIAISWKKNPVIFFFNLRPKPPLDFFWLPQQKPRGFCRCSRYTFKNNHDAMVGTFLSLAATVCEFHLDVESGYLWPFPHHLSLPATLEPRRFQRGGGETKGKIDGKRRWFMGELFWFGKFMCNLHWSYHFDDTFYMASHACPHPSHYSLQYILCVNSNY